MVLRARKIMTKRVVTVRSEAPLTRAESLLREYHFTALPVLDNRGRLVGIVSAIDVLRHRLEAGESPNATVAEVMTRDVLSMKPNTNVAILTHRMRRYGELRVIPIAERGELFGVVTRSDLLRGHSGWLSRMVDRVTGRAGPRGYRPRAYEESAALVAARRAPRPAVDWSRADLAVRDVMTSGGLVTVTATTSTEEAVDLLTRHRFSAVPVVAEGDRLIGIVSEADLLRDPLDGRSSTRARTVGGVMTREVVTVAPDAPVGVVIGEVVEHRLRVVPVVESDRLVGIVTRTDLL